MKWCIAAGLVAVIVGTWVIVALFAEVSDEQDAAPDEPELELAPERKRTRSRATRF
ncbi:MAG: hypothetical protein V4531_00535 [Actinomycetota bacterium]